MDLEASWEVQRKQSGWQLLNGAAEFPPSLRYWWSCRPFSPLSVLWRSHVIGSSCPQCREEGKCLVTLWGQWQPIKGQCVDPDCFSRRKHPGAFSVWMLTAGWRQEKSRLCWFIHLTRKPRYLISHRPDMCGVYSGFTCTNYMLTWGRGEWSDDGWC